MTSKKEQKARQVREAREWLQWRFPALFEPGVPLAIGEHAPIHETARAEGGPEPWAIRAALQSWTNHPKYLKALAKQRTRRHIDGSEAGPVTAEQAERARRQLAEIERKRKQAREDEKRRKAKEGKKAPQGEEPQGKQPQGQQPQAKKSKAAKPGGRPTITLKKKRRPSRRDATGDEGRG